VDSLTYEKLRAWARTRGKKGASIKNKVLENGRRNAIGVSALKMD
jgi:hypothetical protein